MVREWGTIVPVPDAPEDEVVPSGAVQVHVMNNGCDYDRWLSNGDRPQRRFWVLLCSEPNGE